MIKGNANIEVDWLVVIEEKWLVKWDISELYGSKRCEELQWQFQNIQLLGHIYQSKSNSFAVIPSKLSINIQINEFLNLQMDIMKKNQIIVILYFQNKDLLLKRHNIHEV